MSVYLQNKPVFFINAVIFGAGLSSLLMALNIIPKTSPKIPMVMGANFAVVPIASTTLNDAPNIETGFQIIAGSTMIVAILCFLAAPFWIKLQRFFPTCSCWNKLNCPWCFFITKYLSLVNGRQSL